LRLHRLVRRSVSGQSPPLLTKRRIALLRAGLMQR
jgi:hypothetical protein